MLSGRRLDLLDPSPLDVEIEDIAHGLARVARWNGQTLGSHIFSVAQHTLLVEQIAKRQVGHLDQRLALAFWITLGRSPTQNERTAAWNFFQKFPSNWSKSDTSAAGLKDAEDVKAAWTSFCRALFATSDFRYLN